MVGLLAVFMASMGAADTYSIPEGQEDVGGVYTADVQRGVEILVNGKDIMLNSVDVVNYYENSGIKMKIVNPSTDTIVAENTPGSDVVSFSNVRLQANTDYVIFMAKNSVYYGVSGYPYTYEKLNITNGVYSCSSTGCGSTIDSNAYNWYQISVSYVNSDPQFNSTSSNQCLIGENCSYSAEASDSDGNVTELNLTVFDDGTQVYQDSQSFSSYSVNYTWSDVYQPTEGDLDARFTVTDDAGASTTEWVNRTIPEKPQIASIECQINNDEWQNCNQSTGFSNNITSIRSEIVDPDKIVYANFTLIDEYDSNYRFKNRNFTSKTDANENEATYVYINEVQEINDSGNWTASVTAKDNVSSETSSMNRSWFVPWGELQMSLDRPYSDIQVKKGKTFNLTGTVTCLSGECASETDGNGGGPEKVEVWADPKPSDGQKTKVVNQRGRLSAGEKLDFGEKSDGKNSKKNLIRRLERFLYDFF
ncbi:hypothetical protein [Natrinema sp. H-ect4]|uniref:hypothetical protein n=1 Tax=Natrinema sp. H-ect4 TaxID=3242699 RepID=UPI0035A97862